MPSTLATFQQLFLYFHVVSAFRVNAKHWLGGQRQCQLTKTDPCDIQKLHIGIMLMNVDKQLSNKVFIVISITDPVLKLCLYGSHQIVYY